MCAHGAGGRADKRSNTPGGFGSTGERGLEIGRHEVRRFKKAGKNVDALLHRSNTLGYPSAQHGRPAAPSGSAVCRRRTTADRNWSVCGYEWRCRPRTECYLCTRRLLIERQGGELPSPRKRNDL